MEKLFASVFADGVGVGNFFLMFAIALAMGILSTFLLSFRIKSSSRFFVAMAIIPVLVGSILAVSRAFISESNVAYANAGLLTIAVTLGLIRFRSANGSSEEMVLVFIMVAIGFASGMGYLAYSIVVGLGASGLFILVSYLPIFEHKSSHDEKILAITIPEDLNYVDVFSDTLEHYTTEYRLIKTKTTNMGSMFRLHYRIKMKNDKEEKELIDEIRTKNGNLEVMIQESGMEGVTRL